MDCFRKNIARLNWQQLVFLRFENLAATNPLLVFSTRKVLPFIQKDCGPTVTTQKSLVIYEFSCLCDARYPLGRTYPRLGDRIKHNDTSLQNSSAQFSAKRATIPRVQTTHLASPSTRFCHRTSRQPELNCAENYSVGCFQITGKAKYCICSVLGVLQSTLSTPKPKGQFCSV